MSDDTSSEMNRKEAVSLAMYAPILSPEKLAEKIYTALQIAQKRGEVLERIRNHLTPERGAE